jgi:spore photoproduct lyase
VFDVIYVEEEIADHPRTRRVLERFPHAARVPCRRYGEVFNRKAQNFRVQKRRPALILARKHGRLVLPAPFEYAIGGQHNFYFSHMLNCLYDCRYCFLQGMYRSAHMVLFLNYEDFQREIRETVASSGDSAVHFFTGYDCDSLALEEVSLFVGSFLGFFAEESAACFELRTKSIAIKPLLVSEALTNCIVAFSLSPDSVARNLELGAPSLSRRVGAMEALQRHGWPLGLRFDPVVYHQHWKQNYEELFASVFNAIDGTRVHSVSLGPFRLPRQYYKTVSRLYPDEMIFAGHLADSNGIVTYTDEIGREMEEFCREQILRYVRPEAFFPCATGGLGVLS